MGGQTTTLPGKKFDPLAKGAADAGAGSAIRPCLRISADRAGIGAGALTLPPNRAIGHAVTELPMRGLPMALITLGFPGHGQMSGTQGDRARVRSVSTKAMAKTTAVKTV